MATETLIERRLREALDLVTDALVTHRADMHDSSDRPCSTCAKSTKALRHALRVQQWHDGPRTCTRCKGTGHHWGSDGTRGSSYPCAQCGATGKVTRTARNEQN